MIQRAAISCMTVGPARLVRIAIPDRVIHPATCDQCTSPIWFSEQVLVEAAEYFGVDAELILLCPPCFAGVQEP